MDGYPFNENLKNNITNCILIMKYVIQSIVFSYQNLKKLKVDDSGGQQIIEINTEVDRQEMDQKLSLKINKLNSIQKQRLNKKILKDCGIWILNSIGASAGLGVTIFQLFKSRFCDDKQISQDCDPIIYLYILPACTFFLLKVVIVMILNRRHLCNSKGISQFPHFYYLSVCYEDYHENQFGRSFFRNENISNHQSPPYNAIRHDGQENVKQYVIQTIKKTFAENYVKEIYKNTIDCIKRLRHKKLNEIDDYINKALTNITSMKEQTEKRQPCISLMAKKRSEKSFDELYGFKETLSDLEYQKNIINIRFEEQEKKIIKDIRDKYQKLVDTFNQQTGRVTHILGLCQNDKQKVFDWISLYAQNSIRLAKEQLKQEMDQNLNFSHYQPIFDQIQTTKNLSDIVDDGKQRAQRMNMNLNKCVIF